MGILRRSTYYDENYRATAALLRARQPYLVRNLIVGTSLLAFTVTVYSVTFKLVKQDDFSDVKPPEQPSKSA